MSRLLDGLNLDMVRSVDSPIEAERQWRFNTWQHLAKVGPSGLQPKEVHALRIYGGAAGIWVDARRTRSLAPSGVTVGVLHTGSSYPDDLTSDGVFYHYPQTARADGRRDLMEIEATKAAGRLGIPIFVIVKPSPQSSTRDVNLGWVQGWDDLSQVFLITFDAQQPPLLTANDTLEGKPFILEDSRPRKVRLAAARKGQQAFRLQVFQRYGPVCAVTGISVPAMLEAVHLRGVAQGGSNDPRNGLVLSAGHHRAFDADLFAIEPGSLKIITAPEGPSRDQLGIQVSDIRHLSMTPHADAISWRFEQWRRKQL